MMQKEDDGEVKSGGCR